MHIRTAVVALAAALLLTACSSSSGTDAKPTASPTHTVSKQTAFLNAVHAASIQSWATAAPGDDEIAVYPQQWCDQLAAGHSVDNILSVRSGLYPSGSNWGTKIGDADQVLILAVTAYCPQYRAEVVQQAQAGGNY